MDDSRSCKRLLKKSASYKYTINKTGDVDLSWKVFNTPFESYCINYRWWECLSSSQYYDIISSGVILNPEFLLGCIGLSKICQGRQISRDVTVCIVDTGTQNKLLFQLCMRLVCTFSHHWAPAKHSTPLSVSVQTLLCTTFSGRWIWLSAKGRQVCTEETFGKW